MSTRPETSPQSDAMAFSIAAKLRSATHVDHKNLEQVPLLARLLNHDLTHEEYSAVLLGFYHFYAPLEPFLSPFAPYRYHSRQQALSSDLNALGISLPKVEKSKFISSQESLTRDEQLLAAFAILYVIEGSTAGGQIISRRIERINPSLPMSFFQIWQRQPDTWQAWRQWSVEVDHEFKSNLLNKCHFDFIIAHASATFNELQAIFRSQSPHIAT
ncbi:MAG: biliverdin-producing heme oxygenase [Firmicutes bacterium]|nr:biliverdin-producing heme oxygenase [Gammaproteobacteria bacterium]MCL5051462.1 biliverdin-producing heme oxygenase [Bacillota bacterium]